MSLVNILGCGVRHCKEKIETGAGGVPDADSGWGRFLGGVCPKHNEVIKAFLFELNNWDVGQERRALYLSFPPDMWLPPVEKEENVKEEGRVL